MLREGDTNGDGLVSKEEFVHLLQVRMQSFELLKQAQHVLPAQHATAGAAVAMQTVPDTWAQPVDMARHLSSVAYACILRLVSTPLACRPARWRIAWMHMMRAGPGTGSRCRPAAAARATCRAGTARSEPVCLSGSGRGVLVCECTSHSFCRAESGVYPSLFARPVA